MKEQEKQITVMSETTDPENSKTKEEDIFKTREIKIEEMAIDGICGVYQLYFMSNSKYKLNRGSQVREEDFGLLFYRMNGPRLYFISSADLISPDFFKGDMTLEEWLDKNREDGHNETRISELREISKRYKDIPIIIGMSRWNTDR